MNKVPTPDKLIDWCRRVEQLKAESETELRGVEIDSPVPVPSWTEQVTIDTYATAEVWLQWSATRTAGGRSVQAFGGRSVFTRDAQYSERFVHQGDLDPVNYLRIDLGATDLLTVGEAADVHAALGQLLAHLAAHEVTL